MPLISAQLASSNGSLSSNAKGRSGTGVKSIIRSSKGGGRVVVGGANVASAAGRVVAGGTGARDGSAGAIVAVGDDEDANDKDGDEAAMGMAGYCCVLCVWSLALHRVLP